MRIHQQLRNSEWCKGFSVGFVSVRLGRGAYHNFLLLPIAAVEVSYRMQHAQIP